MFNYNQSQVLFTSANVGVIEIGEDRKAFHEALEGTPSSRVYVGQEAIHRVAKRENISQEEAFFCILLHEAGHSKARYAGLNRVNEVLAWELAKEILVSSKGLFPVSLGILDKARESALATYRKGKKAHLFPQWELEAKEYINSKPKLLGPPKR